MSPARPRILRPWMMILALAIIVIVVASFNVKVVSTAEADAASVGEFDPVDFAAENYAAIAGYVDDNAVDLSTLLADLSGGADEAEAGNTSGASSAFAFPVTFEGVAASAAPPVMAVTVDGVPPEVVVQVQVGPALNGTALRDVSGEVSFNQFTNQLEYQNVGTELNNIVRQQVLADFDAAAAAGKTVRVTGVFLRVNPALVSIVPTSIEVVN